MATTVNTRTKRTKVEKHTFPSTLIAFWLTGNSRTGTAATPSPGSFMVSRDLGGGSGGLKAVAGSGWRRDLKRERVMAKRQRLAAVAVCKSKLIDSCSEAHPHTWSVSQTRQPTGFYTPRRLHLSDIGRSSVGPVKLLRNISCFLFVHGHDVLYKIVPTSLALYHSF